MQFLIIYKNNIRIIIFSVNYDWMSTLLSIVYAASCLHLLQKYKDLDPNYL